MNTLRHGMSNMNINPNDRVRFRRDLLEKVGNKKPLILALEGTVRKVKDFDGLKLAFINWDKKIVAPECDVRRLEKIKGEEK